MSEKVEFFGVKVEVRARKVERFQDKVERFIRKVEPVVSIRQKVGESRIFWRESRTPRQESGMFPG